MASTETTCVDCGEVLRRRDTCCPECGCEETHIADLERDYED